jgi:hypothetical protein
MPSLRRTKEDVQARRMIVVNFREGSNMVMTGE